MWFQLQVEDDVDIDDADADNGNSATSNNQNIIHFFHGCSNNWKTEKQWKGWLKQVSNLPVSTFIERENSAN